MITSLTCYSPGRSLRAAGAVNVQGAPGQEPEGPAYHPRSGPGHGCFQYPLTCSQGANYQAAGQSVDHLAFQTWSDAHAAGRRDFTAPSRLLCQQFEEAHLSCFGHHTPICFRPVSLPLRRRFRFLPRSTQDRDRFIWALGRGVVNIDNHVRDARRVQLDNHRGNLRWGTGYTRIATAKGVSPPLRHWPRRDEGHLQSLSRRRQKLGAAGSSRHRSVRHA